jgi:hypothetical protein
MCTFTSCSSAVQMSFSDSVFYYWSDKEWDSCDKFRTAATGVLNPMGYPNMLEWSGSDTTVHVPDEAM